MPEGSGEVINVSFCQNARSIAIVTSVTKTEEQDILDYNN